MVRINAILPEDTLVKIDAIAKEKKKTCHRNTGQIKEKIRQVERCFRGQKVEGITQMEKFTEI